MLTGDLARAASRHKSHRGSLWLAHPSGGDREQGDELGGVEVRPIIFSTATWLADSLAPGPRSPSRDSPGSSEADRFADTADCPYAVSLIGAQGANKQDSPAMFRAA